MLRIVWHKKYRSGNCRISQGLEMLRLRDRRRDQLWDSRVTPALSSSRWGVPFRVLLVAGNRKPA